MLNIFWHEKEVRTKHLKKFGVQNGTRIHLYIYDSYDRVYSPKGLPCLVLNIIAKHNPSTLGSGTLHHSHSSKFNPSRKLGEIGVGIKSGCAQHQILHNKKGGNPNIKTRRWMMIYPAITNNPNEWNVSPYGNPLTGNMIQYIHI